MQHKVPRTITEITSLVNFSEMKRTIRMRETYYYKANLPYNEGTIRLSYSTKRDVLYISTHETFSTTTTFVRKESVEVDFSNKLARKMFRESFIKTQYDSVIYPLKTDEDLHFQEMLEHDKYYPSFKDVMNLLDLKQTMLYDTKCWELDNLMKEKERIKNIPDYVKFRYKRKFKK